MSSKKSFIAKIEEAILKSTKFDFMDSKQKAEDFINDRLDAPEISVRSIFKSVDFKGMEVFTFGNAEAKNTILYVHGGAYVNQINHQHLLYCFLMSRKLDAQVIAPAYPLAPSHHADETYDLITELYRKLMERNDVILMGDSAGGGFAHSFCQYLNVIGLKQPKKIITFSPWVDVSMSSPPYASESDPILGEIGLREIGKSWAGSLNTKDYRISPLFGVNEGLADTVIFAGENEIFYEDILKYVENLKNDGVNVRLIVGRGLFHIYPLFPMPEAKAAFEEIKREILE